ncbi:alpha-hydroxy-acid oxidizing protein [Eubacterium pyruvativorans]|uniref:alpha-hydroxy-acid oxidizing protein n=1 Tax=Eubacterium pyruvativorans TaxID=155865 RepID=UPI001967168B|nr:alpha-hydroxy-acid oxidizing protein [Eubacterium pyruvativorans]
MTMNTSPWPGPAGLILATSGKADDANLHNRSYLDRIHLEMRVIDSVEPDLRTTIFGETFDAPIMTPAFSHLNKVGEDGKRPMVQYADAARTMNCLNWVGMEPDEDFREILDSGARTVRIIKPFQDHRIIFDQIRFAEENGAFAVGIDIDHIAGTDGRYDVVDGIPMGPVKQEDLRQYAASTTLPFIAKGVLSLTDARKARDAGCRGIVVSHHHGRIPFGIAPARVLPAIRSELKDSGMTIFADCGVDDGYDAYKLLALGADAVSVGRGILRPLLKEGTASVVQKMTRMNEQLAELMMYTGVRDTRSFDPDVLYFD